jgi:hypothetical protein
MTACVVRGKGSLDGIRDASALYDEYYGSVREDLDREDRLLLRVAGIVAFLRVVDQADPRQMEQIGTVFGIPPGAFRDAVQRLHDMELLDLYEDEVARVSDQVLATYLFYLAFFKARALDVSALLDHWYPGDRERVIDALKPVTSAFGATLVQALAPHVERVWSTAEAAGDEARLLRIVDDFALVRPLEALLSVHERIERMEPQPRSESAPPFKRALAPAPSIISILASFRDASGEERRAALELLLDLLAKHSSRASNVRTCIEIAYGYREDSSSQGYAVERDVVDALEARMEADPGPLFTGLFLALTPQLLKTTCMAAVLRGSDAAYVRYSPLKPGPELAGLRRDVWRLLFAMADGPLRGEVLVALRAYAADGASAAIVAEDAAELLPFLLERLNPADHHDCVVVQEVLAKLEASGVPVPPELRDRFSDELHLLVSVLVGDTTDPSATDPDEQTRARLERIRDHFAGYDVGDYMYLFGRCGVLHAYLPSRKARGRLRAGVTAALHLIPERDAALYSEVLACYLALNDPLDLRDYGLVVELVRRRGHGRAYEVLSATDSACRHRWLFDFYRLLPANAVTSDYVDELCELYRTASARDLPDDPDFLLRYAQADGDAVARVVEILAERAEGDWEVQGALASMLDSRRELSRTLPALLADWPGRLRQVYRVARRGRLSVDQGGVVFDALLDADRHFAKEYVEWVFADHPTGLNPVPNPGGEHRDYAFLWRRADHAEIMAEVADRLFTLERGHKTARSWLYAFLSSPDDDEELGIFETAVDVVERQDRFLAGLVASRAGEPELMEWLFGTIARLPEARRRPLLAVFVSRNTSCEHFERLPLYREAWPHDRTVPEFQTRAAFLQSLLPLLTGVVLLRHRRCIERRLGVLRGRIAQEQREDFMKHRP